MAQALTSFNSFFDQLGQPPGTPPPGGFDVGSDMAPHPTAEGGSQAQSPVQINPGSTQNVQTSQAQQPVKVNPGSTQNVQTAGFASPQQPAAPAPKKTSAQIQTTAFAAPQTTPDYAALFAPVAQKAQGASQKLQETTGQFAQQVTPFRDYDSSGAQGALEGAIGEGATEEQTQTAKGFLGAKYAGPTGLDRSATDELFQELGSLRSQAGMLGTGGGAEDLLRQRSPNLTMGQRRFEAGRLLKDQGFRDAARGYETGVENLYQDLARARGEASDIGKQRTQEEEDIARRSSEYLGGKQGELSSTLEASVAEKRARDKALQDAYGKFSDSGSVEDLAALGVDTSNFDTEAGRMDTEAEGVKAGIMGKEEYAGLKDVPLMELTVDEHGREKLQIPKEWWKENTAGMSKQEKKALKESAKARQLELENAGFTPGSAAAKNQKSVRQDAAKQAGKYSAYDSLYFGDGMGEFEPEDYRSFVNYQPGMEATRDSVASQAERERYNRIAGLLGSPDEITEADPYSEGRIEDEGARYKSEQEAALKSRGETLEERRKAETKKVQKARGKVRDARLARSLSKTLGNDTLGSTFAGILEGDPKAVANLPFALAAAPVDEAMDTGGQGEISQMASLSKKPRKHKTGRKLG